MGRVSVPSSLSEFTVAPAALMPLADSRVLEESLRASLAGTQDARTLAHLANLLVRQNRYAEALDLYERAASLDPAFPEAWIAASDLAYVLRDEPRAERALDRALALCRYYADPDPRIRPLRLVMLMRDAPYSVNAPLELLLDRSRVAIDRCYIDGFRGALPKGAVAMTAFGHWDGAATAVAAALPHARINDPRMLERCSRERLRESLAGVRGVRAVASHAVSAAGLDAISLPVLVRPVGTHAGRGLALVESREALREHAVRFPSPAYDVSAYVEYRSPDGYFRKYRLAIVDGKAFPYHLAISPRWMVHYQSSPMAHHQWMRDEELSFLQVPASVFGSWESVTRDIAAALTLEYVALDVTRLPDGTMLVFEADPAMLVHDEEADSVFAYKRPFVAAIREALTRLIERRS